MTPPVELAAAQLRRRFDPARFDFASTAEAPDLEGIIGQGRASRAIEFGLEIPYPGSTSSPRDPPPRAKRALSPATWRTKRPGRCRRVSAANTEAGPADHAPPASRRGQPAAGSGRRFLTPVAETLDKVFVSDQYVQNRNALGRQLDQLRSERFRALDATVKERSFTLARRGGRVHVEPGQGRPDATAPEQYEALPEPERDAINEQGQAVQELKRRGHARCRS